MKARFIPKKGYPNLPEEISLHLLILLRSIVVALYKYVLLFHDSTSSSKPLHHILLQSTTISPTNMKAVAILVALSGLLL